MRPPASNCKAGKCVPPACPCGGFPEGEDWPKVQDGKVRQVGRVAQSLIGNRSPRNYRTAAMEASAAFDGNQFGSAPQRAGTLLFFALNLRFFIIVP